MRSYFSYYNTCPSSRGGEKTTTTLHRYIKGYKYISVEVVENC